MKLRKPCQHDRYERHNEYNQHGVYAGVCPGGVFLPDDTLIIRKGNWPDYGGWPPLAIAQIMQSAPNMTLPRAVWLLDALSVREAE